MVSHSRGQCNYSVSFPVEEEGLVSDVEPRLLPRAMAHTVSVVAAVLVASSLAFAQEGAFHRNNISVGLGAATPVGNATNYLTTAPLVTIGYGYRFNRLFQADAGLQAAFGAANNQNGEMTDFGPVQGGDQEFMIPLGGRVYVPQPFKRPLDQWCV